MNVKVLVLVLVSQLCVWAPVFADTPPATLQWDPSPEGTVVGYIVYVGQAPGSYEEAYDVSRQTSFVYTKIVPGRSYFFSVAAYTAGPQVGPRSEEVFFIAGSGTTLSPLVEQPRGEEGAARAVTAATDRGSSYDRHVLCLASAECYGVENVAYVAGAAGSLTRTADGRVFFIEEGRHVRVLENDLLMPEPVLSARTPGMLAGLALDPEFAETRFVYVGSVEERPDGSRELNIIRYRDVSNTLGEGATIVAGLPLPATGDPSFTVDRERRLYVAMPGPSVSDARTNRYAGMVLRFEGDGTAVRSDGPGAPVVSRGYAQPASLAWTSAGNELVLAGTGADWAGTLARLSLNRVSAGVPAVPESLAHTATSTVVSVGGPGPSAEQVSGAGSGVRANLMVVDEAGGVFQIVSTPQGMLEVPWMAPNALGNLVLSAIRGVTDDDVYLVVAIGDDPASRSSRILRLRRQ